MIELKAKHITGIVKIMKKHDVSSKIKELVEKYKDSDLTQVDAGFDAFIEIMSDERFESFAFDTLELIGLSNPRDMDVLELIEEFKNSNLKQIASVFQSALKLTK